MMPTVDLVIAGGGRSTRAAAVGALRRGERVLVVLRSADARVARRLRRWLRMTAGSDAGRLTVMTCAEVVCVDGIDAVEAVVVRHVRTRRLAAVNASAFVSGDASWQPRSALGTTEEQTALGAGEPSEPPTAEKGPASMPMPAVAGTTRGS